MGKAQSDGPGMNTEEANSGKTKKTRLKRAMYQKEVKAEQNKGVFAVDDNTDLSLPMPQHDIPSNTYIS